MSLFQPVQPNLTQSSKSCGNGLKQMRVLCEEQPPKSLLYYFKYKFD